VDFSDDSEAALEWALRHAARDHAPVIALHVIHDPAEAPGFYTRPDKSSLEPLADIAEEMMEDFLQKFFAEHPDLVRTPAIRTEFVSGLPPTRITEVAERERAALIVMGTEGRTGLHGLLIGSVAERVLQMAKAPVVVVKAEAVDEQ
jgi:nucleotide-binding universal stress UspA family protein